jgi:hypothetical protein
VDMNPFKPYRFDTTSKICTCWIVMSPDSNLHYLAHRTNGRQNYGYRNKHRGNYVFYNIMGPWS